MSQSNYDPPLPPPSAEMQMQTAEHFMHLQPDSFKVIEQAPSFLVRDTDVERLSGGAVGAKIYRANADSDDHSTVWHWHEWDFQVAYVTRGWAEYEFEGVGVVRVEAGSIMFQLPNNRHRELNSSSDFEVLEITVPGRVNNIVTIPNEKGEWISQRV